MASRKSSNVESIQKQTLLQQDRANKNLLKEMEKSRKQMAAMATPVISTGSAAQTPSMAGVDDVRLNYLRNRSRAYSPSRTIVGGAYKKAA